MLKRKKKKLMLLGISLLAFTLLIVGCSEETNQAPVIEELDESTSGLEATITGSVSDSDGSVSEVEIAWGDENTDTVSSGFDNIEESHTYDSEGTYDVTVTATDDEGETTSQTISVTSNSQAVEVTKDDLTGDGTEDIKLENDEVFFQLNGDNIEMRQFANQAGLVGKEDVVDPLETYPKSPISSTKSVGPKYQETKKFDVTKNEGEIAEYEVVREYTLNEIPLQIAWTVALEAEAKFAIAEVELKNVGDDSLKIAQDSGDTHSGIQLFNGLGLKNCDETNSDYQFYLSEQETRAFGDQNNWSRYAPAEWGTVFDDQIAVTAGYLSGSTEPNMWITNGDVRVLDYLVKEANLDPDEAINYKTFVGLHEGGDTAPEIGEEIYQTVKSEF